MRNNKKVIRLQYTSVLETITHAQSLILIQNIKVESRVTSVAFKFKQLEPLAIDSKVQIRGHNLSCFLSHLLQRNIEVIKIFFILTKMFIPLDHTDSHFNTLSTNLSFWRVENPMLTCIEIFKCTTPEPNRGYCLYIISSWASFSSI